MKENWFLRLSKWTWTPLLLGVVVCLAVAAIAKTESWEIVPAGIGLICFAWLAAVKGFVK